jgi:hypothetical protein
MQNNILKFYFSQNNSSSNKGKFGKVSESKSFYKLKNFKSLWKFQAIQIKQFFIPQYSKNLGCYIASIIRNVLKEHYLQIPLFPNGMEIN